MGVLRCNIWQVNAVTLGGPVMFESSTVITVNSQDRVSTDTCKITNSQVWLLKHKVKTILQYKSITIHFNILGYALNLMIQFSILTCDMNTDFIIAEHDVIAWWHHKWVRLHTLFILADVCSTAVRKPVGKVKPDIQKMVGGWAVSAHLASWSTRITRSLVQAASGFRDGYACRWTHISWLPWFQSVTFINTLTSFLNHSQYPIDIKAIQNNLKLHIGYTLIWHGSLVAAM